MEAMHWSAEHLPSLVTCKSVGGQKLRRPIRRKTASKNRRSNDYDEPCDKASPAAVVMLHLRSRYVSKAAILTVPILFVPVENRSPA
jgi:hypothetical protein